MFQSYALFPHLSVAETDIRHHGPVHIGQRLDEFQHAPKRSRAGIGRVDQRLRRPRIRLRAGQSSRFLRNIVEVSSVWRALDSPAVASTQGLRVAEATLTRYSTPGAGSFTASAGAASLDASAGRIAAISISIPLLKVELADHLHVALALRTADLPEQRRGDGLRRRAQEDRRVRQVEGFAAKLEVLPLGDVELLARATGPSWLMPGPRTMPTPALPKVPAVGAA